MTVNKIFELEERNDDNLYDIHFYMEGSFWRAYEWSAYLSRIFPSDLNNDERLKVIKKLPKGYDDGYVLVGLKLSSFEKYFPNVTNNENAFEMLDKHIIIHAKEYFGDKVFPDYANILADWKKTINASNKEIRKSKKAVDVKESSNFSLDSLLKEIISFPIENKNLIEGVSFLSHIKDIAIKITKTE